MNLGQFKVEEAITLREGGIVTRGTNDLGEFQYRMPNPKIDRIICRCKGTNQKSWSDWSE